MVKKKHSQTLSTTISRAIFDWEFKEYLKSSEYMYILRDKIDDVVHKSTGSSLSQLLPDFSYAPQGGVIRAIQYANAFPGGPDIWAHIYLHIKP